MQLHAQTPCNQVVQGLAETRWLLLVRGCLCALGAHFHLHHARSTKNVQVSLVVSPHMDDTALWLLNRQGKNVALAPLQAGTATSPVLQRSWQIRLLQRCCNKGRWQGRKVLCQDKQRNPRWSRGSVAIPLFCADGRHGSVIACQHQQAALPKKTLPFQLAIKISKRLVCVCHRRLLAPLKGFLMLVGHVAGHCVDNEQARCRRLLHDLQGRIVGLLIGPDLKSVVLLCLARGRLGSMQMLKANPRKPLVNIQKKQRTAGNEMGAVSMVPQTCWKRFGARRIQVDRRPCCITRNRFHSCQDCCQPQIGSESIGVKILERPARSKNFIDLGGPIV